MNLDSNFQCALVVILWSLSAEENRSKENSFDKSIRNNW